MSTTSEAKPDTKAKPPVHKERLAFVEAAVWENEVGTEGKTRFHVTLSKSYKDGEGKWHQTTSLHRDDLLAAAYALMKCYDFITEAEGTATA